MHEIRILKGVEGKKLKVVSVVNEPDYCCVIIDFTDCTSLCIDLHATVNIKPELQDWKTGNHRKVRQYPTVTEKVCL